MPYLLLVLGIVVGLYALYRFFINANIKQIKALFMSAGLVTVIVALFVMAVTGRLAAALGLGAAIIPFVIAYLRERNAAAYTPTFEKNSKIKTRRDALQVLGLSDDASDDDIRNAYKKLMKKAHPDHEGSEWIAAKINEARDFLLNDS